MNAISENELDCLRMIAGEQPCLHPPCSDAVLQGLLSSRLIEQVPHVWLPLEMHRMAYRLTAAGQATLQG